MVIRSPESFFARSMRATVALGLLGAAFGAVYAGFGLAGRYLLFLCWMVANLYLWAASLRELLGRKRAVLLAPLVALKILWIAVLLVLCAWVGIRGTPRLTAFLLGLNTPFLVMFLKAVGAALTQRQTTPPVFIPGMHADEGGDTRDTKDQ